MKLYALLVCLVLTCAINSLPAIVNQRSRRQKIPDEPYDGKTNGCTKVITEWYNVTSYDYNFTSGTYQKKITQTSRTKSVCCEGYSGEDCSIPYVVNVTCGGIVCPSHPDALCVINRHCGKNIELFLDRSSYLVVTDCVPKNVCLGACERDPCEDATCDKHPSALCFTDCNCQTMWLLPATRKRVECTERQAAKRDTENSCS